MLSPLIVSALCALALLIVASVRRVPEGHVYSFRRMGGHIRLVGSGTHLVMPLVERVAHKISLAGAAVPVDHLQLADQRFRGVVYFQVLDPQRAGMVIEDLENLLRTRTRALFADPAMPEVTLERRAWLKRSLNAQLRDSGLLIARVDLNALD